MIIATVGVKGGGGKSTVSFHFVASYFLIKEMEKVEEETVEEEIVEVEKEPDVYIYEFDADNKTSEDFSKVSPEMVKITTIGNDRDLMVKAISEIEFLHTENKNIVIDVGGSDNTKRFLDLVEETSGLAKEIIFVVPEINKTPRGAESTVEKILKIEENAKIIVALNFWDHNVEKENQFKFFYGDPSIDVPPSHLASNKKVKVSTIPRAEMALGLTDKLKDMMFFFAEEAIRFASKDGVDKRRIWAEEEGVEDCDMDLFIQRNKYLDGSKYALRTLNRSAHFFKALDSFNDSGKTDG